MSDQSVFVVWELGYEGNTLLAIYGSQEAAERYLAAIALAEQRTAPPDRIEIEETRVLGAPPPLDPQWPTKPLS